MVENAKKGFELHPTQTLALGFITLILIGSILLSLPFASKNGLSVGYINALFTAASAVCVTGLVVVDTATHWSTFGQVVIIILIQIGGIGFITMGTLFALLIGRKITFSERKIMQEALNKITASGVVRLTKYILIMTFILEAIGAIILSIRFIPIYGPGKGIWYSVFHSISAFCNAGFDLIGNFRSLTPFVNDPIITLTVATLVILGGIGFVVILEVINTRNFKKLSLHSKFAVSITGALLVLGFFLVFFLEYNNPETMGNLPLGGKVLSAIFHSVTPRTAGFNTLPTGQLVTATLFITIIFMFIGGSSASTAGGVKVTTIGIFIAMIISALKGKNESVIFNRKISRSLINKAFVILGLSTTLVIITITLLSITEQHGFMAIVFESVSAFGTVGLSTGITPTLTNVGKIVITLTMFFGRLGPLTVFMALAESTTSPKGLVKYPEEKVVIG